MDDLKKLQQDSVRQYRDFYSLTLSLEEPLKRLDVETILRITHRIEEIKKEVMVTDQLVNRSTASGVGDHLLQAERMELMKKILGINKTLMPKIQAMMAMQASDLSKIKTGMNSLGGYARPAPPSGKIINTSN